MKNLADVQMPGDTPVDTSRTGVQMFEPSPVKKVVRVDQARPNYRAPTKDEQITAWEMLMFQINLRRNINEKGVVEQHLSGVESCLKRIDAFVNAHNGHLRSPAEIRQDVIQAFWEQIAETPSIGLRPADTDAETAPKKNPAKRAPAKKTRKKKATTGAKRGRKPKAPAAA